MNWFHVFHKEVYSIVDKRYAGCNLFVTFDSSGLYRGKKGYVADSESKGNLIIIRFVWKLRPLQGQVNFTANGKLS